MFHYSPSEVIIRETYQRHCTTERLEPWLESQGMAAFAVSHVEWSYRLGISFAKDLHLGTMGSPPDLEKNPVQTKALMHLMKKKIFA